MAKRYLIITIFAIFIFLCANTYAQETDYSECMNNFNIDEIVDTKDDGGTEVNWPLLKNYFQCRAVARGNKGECDKLPSSFREKCYTEYTFRKDCLAEIVNNKRSTGKLIASCQFQDMAITKEQREEFVNAIIKNDDEYCKSFTNSKQKNVCLALTTLNENLASVGFKDEIYLMKAVKNSDSNICKKMKSKRLSVQCQAYVDYDERLCEQEYLFQQFKKDFCKDYGGAR